ncbi:MAG: lysophospholipid acyltransferase family protein [Bdellovibrionota bacterium]
MLVANHQSYIDILSILSLFPCRFVTFTEMAHTIGVGLITKLSQTLFVHRSRPSLVRKDIAHLESELVKGIPFVFFPEGGSFDGSALQPFKSSLFESAIKTETPIQPVCLRYIEINGEPVTLKNRDQIFYHGEMNLVRQLIGILNLRSVTVEAVFSPIIEVSGKSRKEVAQLSREEIAQNFAAVSI